METKEKNGYVRQDLIPIYDKYDNFIWSMVI